jgi:SPP1 family predicted phage head-tail adaptor
MRAGETRHYVRFVKPVETQSDSGDTTYTYVTLASRWVSNMPFSGRELIAADQMSAISNTRLFCRWFPGLTADCRMIFKGRTIELNFVRNINERNVDYEILCKEAV